MASDVHVIGVRVDPVTYDDVVGRICRWAAAGESRYVCAANVSMLVEARADPQFHDILEQADVVTPDGMPLVWALRRSGHRQPTRVYGPDLTLAVCERAAQTGIPVGFIGGDTATLNSLVAALTRRFDGLRVVYMHSPPFRAATRHETEAINAAVIAAGVRILFVGLGCPKQERWMAAHRGQLPAVMLGVGAAFDFLSGNKRQAPHWMQRRGLEWLFRLLTEPGRLFARYARDIPRYAAYVVADRWRVRRRRGVVVAVLGPDGSGKDSVIAELRRDPGREFLRTRTFHFRPHFGSQHRACVVAPHAQEPRSRAASVAKLGYYALDFVLALPMLAWARARGWLVLFNRNLSDLVADPRRYRYAGSLAAARWCSTLVDRPDLIFVLDAPAQLLAARKRELSPETIATLRSRYRALAGGPAVHVIDAARPLPDVVAEVRAVIQSHRSGRAA